MNTKNATAGHAHLAPAQPNKIKMIPATQGKTDAASYVMVLEKIPKNRKSIAATTNPIPVIIAKFETVTFGNEIKFRRCQSNQLENAGTRSPC